VPTEEVGLCAHSRGLLSAHIRGVALCPPRRCACVPIQVVGVWLLTRCGCVPTKKVGAVCPLKRWGSVPTQEVSLHATEEVLLCAHPRGVAVCPPKKCGCLPLRDVAMCPLGLWLCAHPRGVTVCTPRGVVGCPQRCVAVCSQSSDWVPTKTSGSVSSKLLLCVHKGEAALYFLVAWQCATQGITLQIVLVVLGLKFRVAL